MEFDEDEIIQTNKPTLSLPVGCESPSHPDHDLFIYLKENDHYRENCCKQSLVLPPTNINPFQITNRIPDPGEDFRIPPEFLLSYSDVFLSHRDEIQSIITHSSFQKQSFPSFQQCKSIILKSPKLEYLASFQNTQIISLLKYARDFCKLETHYSHVFVEWVYCLLLLIQTPLDAEVSSVLNDVLRYFCRAKHAILDKKDPTLLSYNIIIAILGIFFGQASEEDIL